MINDPFALTMSITFGRGNKSTKLIEYGNIATICQNIYSTEPTRKKRSRPQSSIIVILKIDFSFLKKFEIIQIKTNLIGDYIICSFGNEFKLKIKLFWIKK